MGSIVGLSTWHCKPLRSRAADDDGRNWYERTKRAAVVKQVTVTAGEKLEGVVLEMLPMLKPHR